MSGFITHTDADGLVSALIYKHFNQKKDFKGFYSLSTFYLTSNLKNKDVAVDLDMNMMKCIGHHCNPYFNPVSQNPNHTHIKDFYKDFKHKCPLNTVMILMNKYNLKVDDLKQLAIVFFCDGFFTYYKKYYDNCEKWLKEYNLFYLIEMFEKNEEEVMRIIDNEIVPIFSSDGNYRDLKVKIRLGKIYNIEILKSFSKYIINAFHLEAPIDLFEKEYKVYNKYSVITLKINNHDGYEELLEELKKNGENDVYFISGALVYNNIINITYKGDWNYKKLKNCEEYNYRR